MKAATAASFSRGVSPPRSASSIARQQQRPALDEELVEDLVLGVEVVVDEPVGDARPRRRCRRRGSRGSPGGRRRGSPRRGSCGACRPAALSPSGARLRRAAARRRPAGRRLASDGQRLADPSWACEVEVGGDEALAVGGDGEQPRPRGRRSPSGRRSRSAAAPRRPGSGRGRRPGSRSPAPAAAPPSGRGRWPR